MLVSLFRLLFKSIFVVFLSVYGWVSAAESQVVKDYHLSVYKDYQGSVNEFELFTKNEQKKVFFGLSCSSQSPLPLLQVILFDDNVISDTPRYMAAELRIDGEHYPAKINGILRVVDTVDEHSNKIRFEIPTKRGSLFKDLRADYADLLTSMKAGQRLSVKLIHRQLGDRELSFSLQGFSELLTSKEALCF